MGIFSNYFEQDEKPKVTNLYEKNHPQSVTIKVPENPEFEKDLKEAVDEFESNKKAIDGTIRHLYSVLEDKKFLTYNDLFLTLDDLFITDAMKGEAFYFWTGDIEVWKQWIEAEKYRNHIEIDNTQKLIQETHQYLEHLEDEEDAIIRAIYVNNYKENN